MILRQPKKPDELTRTDLPSCGVTLWLKPYDAALYIAGQWNATPLAMKDRALREASDAPGLLNEADFRPVANGNGKASEPSRIEVMMNYYAAMGALIIARWEGVQDEEGNSLEFSEDYFRMFLHQSHRALGDWIDALSEWIDQGSAEGNGSTVAPPGTTAAVRTSAESAGKRKPRVAGATRARRAGGANTGSTPRPASKDGAPGSS